MLFRSRWVAIGAAIGVAFGGIAYAVVVNPPSSSNRFYACVSPSGVVKSGTLRLNVAPTKCPTATDQVQSWNAVGQTGSTGATGATGAGAAPRTISWPSGVTGPTGPDPIGYVGTYALTVTTDGCNIVNPDAGYKFDDLRVRLVTLDGFDPGVTQGSCGQSIGSAPYGVSLDGAPLDFLTAFPGITQLTHLGGDVELNFTDKIGRAHV